MKNRTTDEIIDYYEKYGQHKFEPKERILISLAMIDYAHNKVTELYEKITKNINDVTIERKEKQDEIIN